MTEIVQQSGALEWMQFVQTLLLALIAWVSIGVYGSFYVIRSLTSPPARRRTHQEIRQEDYPESVQEDLPATQERRRLALDAAGGDDGWPPEVFEDIEVPQSPKELRLAALVICGFLGVFAVLVLAALGWVGSMSWPRSWPWPWGLRWLWGLRWRICRFVVRWLLTGGPDWVA